MPRKTLFVVETPLGEKVILSRNRWREIVRFKHPALDGKEDLVRQCLTDPEHVRASSKDPDVHLYYLRVENRYVCVVVGHDEDADEHFVVTAYFAEKMKKGDELWTK